MNTFWVKYLKSDMLERTEQLKDIVDIIERNFLSLNDEKIRVQLEGKGIAIKYLKAQFLNSYFEDLLEAVHEEE